MKIQSSLKDYLVKRLSDALMPITNETTDRKKYFETLNKIKELRIEIEKMEIVRKKSNGQD